MADVFLSHIEWSGAGKGPTMDVASFSRDLEMSVAGLTLSMSSAPRSGGDPSRANPEQLLVAAVSACQALTYLYVAAKHGVPIAGYSDDAQGHLTVVDGWLRMGRVTLRPHITLLAGADEERARTLVQETHRQCVIANSLHANVHIEPTFAIAETP